MIGLIADIDREKREKERLKEMAEKDSLTGLYNRGAVQTLIQRYVVKATPDDCCALMILDAVSSTHLSGGKNYGQDYWY